MDAQYNAWYSTDFTGHYPVGTAAIVVCDTKEEAKVLLTNLCRKHGLKGFDGTIKRIRLDMPNAIMLRDGDY